MERFAQRERVLLGPSSPSSEPDIDFNDVFGGPPKRSTSHESRYGFAEPTRRDSRALEDDDDVFLHRDPLSGVRERPVFGEEIGNRRKYPSDDFYDDVFSGEESVGSPRRLSHEPFGSSPRVLSPSRPLPPRADPIGTSLPAQIQFSLPAKLTRGADSPIFASGNRKYKEPISNVKGFPYTPSSPIYKPSPLSHQVSLNKEVPYSTVKHEELKSPEVQSKVKNDSKTTEAANNGNQFHFSIYRWASKGVPMLMPLRRVKSGKLNDTIKTEMFSGFNKTIESDKMGEKLDIKDSKRNVSGNNKVHAEEVKPDRSSPPKSSTNGIKETGELKTTKMNFETESFSAILRHTRAEIEVTSQDTQEPQKPELRPLRPFLGSSADEGNSKTNQKSEQKDKATKKPISSDTNNDATKNEQKRDEKKYYPKREEAIQVKEPQSVDSKRASKENIGRSKAKGMVKEFVKIFNQEGDLKPKADIEARNQSSKWGFTSNEKADKDISAKTPPKNGNQVQGVNTIQTPGRAAVLLDKNHEELEKQHSHLNTSVADVKGNISSQKDDQASNFESHPDNTQAIDEDIDDLFHENFMVQELTNDQDKPVQGEENYEDIQTSDARIREWSRGKESNIRSLLSTLQYVLWSGSGWKPVPLVDIIEASAVKRSYQRALLCLHPDKLQQKGAADYQKHTAEKVFDILQEAWDQFNSLGLM